MSTNEHEQSGTSAGNQGSTEITREQFEALQEQLVKATSTNERLLNQYKDAKGKLQGFKQKEEEALTLQKQQEEERLRKEGNLQVLLDQRDEQIKMLQSDLSTVKEELGNKDESILNLKKASAFEKQIGGKIKNGKYWNLVDFNSIAVNPETGEIDKDSLAQYAGEFVKDHQALVDFGSTGNLPNSGHNGTSGTSLTYDQWRSLPLAERKKRMKDVRR